MGVSEPLIQSVLLGEAVEHAPVAVLVADDEMRFVAANEYACRLLGYSRAELLELRVPDVAKGEEVPREFAEVQAHGRLEGKTIMTRKDGTALPLCYRAAETKIGGLVYYVSISWPEP